MQPGSAACNPPLRETPQEKERERECRRHNERGRKTDNERENRTEREGERWRKKIHSLSSGPRQHQKANDSETESRRTNRRGTIYQHAPVRRLDHWLRP